MKYNHLFEQYRTKSVPKQNLLVQCERKWRLFRNDMNFQHKTVLDIGCTEGHSCIEAWANGVASVVGIEAEPGWTEVGELVKKHLGITNSVRFVEESWEAVVVRKESEFDIVLALGFLHHISIGQYEDVLEKMCTVCRETLVLENRVDVEEKSKSYIRAEFRPDSKITVFVPSAKYLTDALNRFGFVVKKTYPINPNKREIWLCVRTKNE